MYKIDSTTVDRACMYLVAQQVIGVGTVISNALKCINDLGKFLAGSCKYEIGKVTVEGEKLDELERSYDKLYNDTYANLVQHIKYIGIGLVRLTPVAGTIYSFRKLYCVKEQN